MNWSQKLRLENAAMHDILRAMTDEQLVQVTEQLTADETAHLRAEALNILETHQRARKLARDVGARFEAARKSK